MVNGLNPVDYFEFFSYDRMRANHSPKLRQPRAKLNRYYYSFSVRIVKHWNALPKEIKEIAEDTVFDTFKSKLRNFLKIS